MDVYKAKSVYKAPGVYRSGIYKDPSEVVLLNGVRYENRFYEIDSDNVGSTFVDAVKLPEGYEKLGRVRNSRGTDRNLINTEFLLQPQFGSIFVAISTPMTNGYYWIFGKNVYTSTKKNTKYVINTRENKTAVSVENEGNNDLYFNEILTSVELTDTNKIRKSLLSNQYIAMPAQSGTSSETLPLYLLSRVGTVDFRFLFIVDRNHRVTFTAIPCKHGNDYGLYDVVAGKFYTHTDLTGD